MEALPTIVSSSEIGILEGAITKTRFMKLLNEFLFATPSAANDVQLRLDASNKWVEKTGISAFEFAYLIKQNEENRRDCDDAERILNVLYATFLKIITYRLSPQTYPDLFLQAYQQQLNHFYRSIASMDCVRSATGDVEQHYHRVLDWINQTGFFLTFSRVKAYSGTDDPVFDQFYKYEGTAAEAAVGCLMAHEDAAKVTDKAAKAAILADKVAKKRVPVVESTEAPATTEA
jgi:hypothetical protein